MKLLSPKEQQDTRATESARDILRAQAAREMEKEWRIKLANAEADFKLTLARNIATWEKEEEVHKQEVARRKEEIKGLEIKRLETLIPSDILNAGSKKRLDEAKKLVTSLWEDEERNETLTDLLESKLDDVGAREQDVKLREGKVKNRERIVEDNINAMQAAREELSRSMTDHLAMVKRDTDTFDTRKTAIELRETNMAAREEGLMRKQTLLENWETRLKDREGTLASAWEELKRMKG